MPNVSAFPAVSGEAGLARYLQEIRKFPVLTANDEFVLSKQLQEHGDRKAAHQLVTSHLRLVAKIAFGYKGYGLPISDLVAEGNIGLMTAVKKFDPDKGFRLATYAMWWIKASMQEYILKSWSLVKIGTTAGQKKLFFNLKKLRTKLDATEHMALSPENLRAIAEKLGVTEAEVNSMDQRLGGADYSLNTTLNSDSEDSWGDFIADESANFSDRVIAANERSYQQKLLDEAMEQLTPREKAIFQARRVQEEPSTLEDLSHVHNISRERVRQLEAKAFERVRDWIQEKAAA